MMQTCSQSKMDNEQIIDSIFGLRPESWSSVQEFLKQLPTYAYGLEPVDCPQITTIKKVVLDMHVCLCVCVFVCVCVCVCV